MRGSDDASDERCRPDGPPGLLAEDQLLGS